MMRNKKEIRAKFMQKARETVKEALKSRDMVLSGVARSIEELNKTINQLTERFESWYQVYFPELKLDDRQKYVQVAVFLDREKIDIPGLTKLVGQKKADEISNLAKRTLGAKLNEKDIKELKKLGERILALYELRDEYQKYEEEIAKEVAPNISEIAGPEVAAKLIAHTGSLEKLAKMPASTIQVLGAEKALFKHLRNKKIAPPKHGIIFQYPDIGNVPKEIRGKIARALANKIAIAAKADAFTKNYIADRLKEDLMARIEEVKTKLGYFLRWGSHKGRLKKT